MFANIMGWGLCIHTHYRWPREGNAWNTISQRFNFFVHFSCWSTSFHLVSIEVCLLNCKRSYIKSLIVWITICILVTSTCEQIKIIITRFLKSSIACKVLGVLTRLGPQLACTSDPNTMYIYQNGDQACQDWKHSIEFKVSAFLCLSCFQL